MNHIVVIGFMGSGKTRVGKRLSSDLGLTFVDVDKVIVKKMNMSVKEILQKFGEPYYRALETMTVKALIEFLLAQVFRFRSRMSSILSSWVQLFT